MNGRVIGSLTGRDIRPTSSKVRQAIFNIIGNDISGYCVIDIFAGSGIMGIEALSRGAAWAVFIDNSNRSLSLIKKNLEICGLSSKGYLIKRDITEGLPSHEKIKQGSIDFIFIDPPYGKDIIPGVLESVVKSSIMADDSYIVTESMKHDSLPKNVGDFFLNKTRLYGETKIDIYSKETE
ncbi:MAG: 16S rRNA (guanine(966)-N(2))-methyltransferase RsmD [Deltaproteobacteria bacterium]|nr:16S rRNA (guanine(966)-N(2))-methyltransferase RsmD [Deltaproteobacteria bacterium]